MKKPHSLGSLIAPSSGRSLQCVGSRVSQKILKARHRRIHTKEMEWILKGAGFKFHSLTYISH